MIEYDYMFVQMHVHFLKNFIEHVVSGVVDEFERISDQSENGEFNGYGDYERAVDYPLFRVKFGSRAVYYELNALMESQLYAKVEPIFQEMRKKGKYKNCKLVNDLPYGEVIKILKSAYGDIGRQIEDWPSFERLRNSVNSFKHRNGMRKFKHIEKNKETGGIELLWQASVDEAREYLETIPNVIQSLWKLKIQHQVTLTLKH